MFQGRRAESEHRNLNLPFEAHFANALILSHAHIDPSGNVPTLCAADSSAIFFVRPRRMIRGSGFRARSVGQWDLQSWGRSSSRSRHSRLSSLRRGQ